MPAGHARTGAAGKAAGDPDCRGPARSSMTGLSSRGAAEGKRTAWRRPVRRTPQPIPGKVPRVGARRRLRLNS